MPLQDISQPSYNLEELKLWKPSGEDWKPKNEIGLQLLSQLKEDLNAKSQSEHLVINSANKCFYTVTVTDCGRLYVESVLSGF